MTFLEIIWENYIYERLSTWTNMPLILKIKVVIFVVNLRSKSVNCIWSIPPLINLELFTNDILYHLNTIWLCILFIEILLTICHSILGINLKCDDSTCIDSYLKLLICFIPLSDSCTHRRYLFISRNYRFWLIVHL